MSSFKIATAANETVVSDLAEGNDYTVIINVNGTAPALSAAVITARVKGSKVFETLEENGTIDLTSPKAVKIMFPGGSPAEIDAITITPNAEFIADPTSTMDIIVNILSVGRPI